MALYPMRYIARVLFEAKTPLFVGSGKASLVRDAVVATDAYGFPYIPGTSLCGVIRHSLEDAGKETSVWKDIFGFADKEIGKGAKLRVSAAYLVLNNEVPALGNIEKYGQVLKRFKYLPTRNHVRINHRGVAMDKGLFDNEIVFKGCRFVAELEMRGDDSDEEYWEEILQVLHATTFRVGHGTRRGYGHLAAIDIEDHRFDLRNENLFERYLNYDPTFCPAISTNRLSELASSVEPLGPNQEGVSHYQLVLRPESFFFFGAGTADDEVDEILLEEPVVYYDINNCIHFSEETFSVIPGSSIKGALRHRTCFYFNLLKERYAEIFANSKLEKIVVEGMNSAVFALFGLEGGAKLEKTDHDGFLEDDNDSRTGRRGVVLIDDQFLDVEVQTHIFNHVAIDRFTGGPIDKALYAEKAAFFAIPDEGEVRIDVHVMPYPAREKELIDRALELALIDVCRGLLPLGGMTTKGHGVFVGQLWKNGEKIFDYEKAIESAK